MRIGGYKMAKILSKLNRWQTNVIGWGDENYAKNLPKLNRDGKFVTGMVPGNYLIRDTNSIGFRNLSFGNNAEHPEWFTDPSDTYLNHYTCYNHPVLSDLMNRHNDIEGKTFFGAVLKPKSSGQELEIIKGLNTETVGITVGMDATSPIPERVTSIYTTDSPIIAGFPSVSYGTNWPPHTFLDASFIVKKYQNIVERKDHISLIEERTIPNPEQYRRLHFIKMLASGNDMLSVGYAPIYGSGDNIIITGFLPTRAGYSGIINRNMLVNTYSYRDKYGSPRPIDVDNFIKDRLFVYMPSHSRDPLPYATLPNNINFGLRFFSCGIAAYSDQSADNKPHGTIISVLKTNKNPKTFKEAVLPTDPNSIYYNATTLSRIFVESGYVGIIDIPINWGVNGHGENERWYIIAVDNNLIAENFGRSIFGDLVGGNPMRISYDKIYKRSKNSLL